MDQQTVTRKVKIDNAYARVASQHFGPLARLQVKERRGLFTRTFEITGPCWAVDKAIAEAQALVEELRNEMRAW